VAVVRGRLSAVVVHALAAAAFVVVVGAGSRAYAHPLVEQGFHRYAEADFAGALEAFSQAWSANGLERDDVVRVLAGRAMVHFAMSDTLALNAALASLASLEPEYTFPREAPPELAAGLAEARERIGGQLAIEVAVAWRGPDAELTARTVHGPSGLVSRVVLHAHGAGARVQTGDDSLVVTDARGHLGYWAEAIGPGGSVLTTLGSATSPLDSSAGMPAIGVDAGGGGGALGGGNDDSSGGVTPWLWVGLGAVVVAGAVIAVLLATSGGTSDQTQPGAPFVL